MTVRSTQRKFAVLSALVLFVAGCGDAASPSGATPATLAVRAERRAFAGAPPVIPHPPQSTECTRCHTAAGMEVPRLGFAPANPHGHTAGLSDSARCKQCHLFRQTEAVFAASTFASLKTVGLRGERAHAAAPPTMPHGQFMRENCLACHDGPSARPETRCTHPERSRCQQCHVASTGLTR
jgi:cytochrome c-type protein NapB